jgi:outer membrane phospholipase A
MRYYLFLLLLASPAFAVDNFKLSVDVTTLPTTVPATVPAEPQNLRERRAAQDNALLSHLAETLTPYQPVYFIAGTEDPIAKFQISFKYQFIPTKSDLGEEFPWLLAPWHVSYSQTTWWDLAEDSAPFFDNSYRPEIFWYKPDLFRSKLGDQMQFDFQWGYQHESNGEQGDESRSLNSLYIEPTLWIGLGKDWFMSFAPRIFYYLGEQEENPDITDYRGLADLKFKIGQYEGLQAAFIGRIGEGGGKGSVQMDLSYPIVKAIPNSSNFLCLHLQVFHGYGETLIEYDQEDSSIRLGLSLVR